MFFEEKQGACIKQQRRPALAFAFFCCAILGLCLNQSAPLLSAQESVNQIDQQVEAIFAQLTPAERVGQLFMVTFEGNDLADGSYINRLIRTHRVGGVWLRSSNMSSANNIALANNQRIDPIAQQALINQMQALAFQTVPTQLITSDIVSPTAEISFAQVITGFTSLFNSRPISGSTNATTVNNLSNFLTADTIHPNPIPLFVATNQGNSQDPDVFVSHSLTNIPSGLAIGATWNVENAQQTGIIVGNGLASVGINMIFGPVLDVIDKPTLNINNQPGVQAFGGNAYWVGKMGQAYIKGLHLGSNNRLLAIAKHFPGAGSIDRQINEDIATVQKTAQALANTELVPFVAVTSQDNDRLAQADGLLTAHIRYKGLQENIRELTQPISLDAQNLPSVLNSNTIVTWRNQGGIIVSGPLGATAIKNAFTTEDNGFPAIQVARHAFLSGNDLLLLSTFGPVDDPATQFKNIVRVLDFFVGRYNMEAEFQQQVDTAVKRLIKAKLHLYGSFAPDNVFQPPALLDNLPNYTDIQTKIARESATLISPGPAELADRLPSPPLPDEKIIIFTDARSNRACDACEETYWLSPIAIQDAILERYGVGAGNQIDKAHIFSFTFTDLQNLLLGNVNTQIRNIQVQTRLAEASWVIFAMLGISPNQPESAVVKTYLQESRRDLRGKNVVAFAFDAPYFLDETEVSVLTAYYGLYNKTPVHIDAAVRVLFKEFQAQGHAPVNIDAITYDMKTIVKPWPEQTISLKAILAESDTIIAPQPTPITAAAEDAPMPIATKLGDRFSLKTDVIVDYNGNPVPDGTEVLFKLSYLSENLALAPIPVLTSDGIAETMISIERNGLLTITAESGQVQGSNTVALETVFANTQITTQTGSLSQTNIVSNVLAIVPTFTATDTTIVSPANTSLRILSMVDLLYSILTLSGFSALTYFLLRALSLPLESRLSIIFALVVGGLIGYVLYGMFAIQLVNIAAVSTWIRENAQHHRITPLVSLGFAVLGAAIGLGAMVYARKSA